MTEPLTQLNEPRQTTEAAGEPDGKLAPEQSEGSSLTGAVLPLGREPSEPVQSAVVPAIAPLTRVGTNAVQFNGRLEQTRSDAVLDTTTPPADLLAQLSNYFKLPAELPEIGMIGAAPALERLGASPLPRGKFPLLGFLEGLYEYVTEQSTVHLPQAGAALQDEAATMGDSAEALSTDGSGEGSSRLGSSDPGSMSVA